MLLGSNGTTIDCRYFGQKNKCLEQYKYIKKNESNLFEFSNYEAKARFTKKTQKDIMKGSHPRCRLELTQVTDISIVNG